MNAPALPSALRNLGIQRMNLRQQLLAAAVLAALSSPSLAELRLDAIGRAQDALRARPALAQAAPGDAFRALDTVVDADGSEHVRFERSHAGLPVLGGDFVLHQRPGRPASSSLSLRAPLAPDMRAELAASDAILVARAAFGLETSAAPEADRVVYARGPAQPRLAWRVHLQGGESDETLVVAAQDGRLLDRWSNRETLAANGTGRTLYSGNVALATNSLASGFELRDPTRGGGYTIYAGTGLGSGQIYKDADNTWGNGTVGDAVSAAADAQFGVATTWDYYKQVHGRSGIANNGKGAANRVHYGRKYGNAFWNDGCFCMTYGDGDGVVIGPLVALDIAGHEMSHGVMSRTAALFYSGESGGLNEANSDIMGTMVEFRANSSSDTPDYLIGEEIFVANVAGSADQEAIRFMFDPHRDGMSANCWTSSIGSTDVHFSSGPANHFYYLLAEGSGARTYSGVDHHSPTCNGATIAGIGRAKAEKIWYRAVSVYMTSDTNYAGARAATLAAAADLYGGASAERAAVAAAWTAVSVN
jgi:Zn-dependent metalloprotease